MLSEIAVFILKNLFQLYTVAIVLRFILQAVRADFYNPVSQMIVKVTDPVLKPLRRVIPGLGGMDVAALVAAVLVQMLMVVTIAMLSGMALQFSGALVISVMTLATTSLLRLVLDVYFWGLLIVVVLSFVAPASYHPIVTLLRQITEPLLAPVRNVIPPMGGLDFSVMVVMMLIIIVRDIVLPGLVPGF